MTTVRLQLPLISCLPAAGGGGPSPLETNHHTPHEHQLFGAPDNQTTQEPARSWGINPERAILTSLCK